MTVKSNTPADCKDCWQTPPEIFAALNAEFNFILDAAASANNALCRYYIDEKENGLTADWTERANYQDGYVWINPPYRNPLPWVNKAADENKLTARGCVMLLNADTSVKWFDEAIKSAHEVRFITGGRLAFISAETAKAVRGNSKGQMLIIWRSYLRTGCEFKTVDKGSLMEFGKRILGMAA